MLYVLIWCDFICDCPGLAESEIVAGGMADAFRALGTWTEYCLGDEGIALQKADPASLNLEVLGQLTKLSERFVPLCEKGLESCTKVLMADPLAPKVHTALQSILSMFKRVECSSIGRCMVALAKNELADEDKKNYKNVLPPHVHSTAHVLQVSWSTEIESLSQGENLEIPLIISKLETLEAAVVARDAESLKDDVFAEARENCSKFISSFGQAVTGLLTTRTAAHTDPLVHFNEKYDALEAAATSWTLKDVEWMFLRDTQEEVKDDLGKIKQRKKEAQDYVDSLTPLAQLQSSFEVIQSISREVGGALGHLKAHIATTCKLACLLVLSDVITCTDGNKEEVERLEKHCQKYYGLGCKDMPPIMSEKLDALKKVTGAKVPEKSPRGSGGEKKTAASEKKEKDKKVAAEDANDKKKRKSDASRASKTAEKVEKHEKKAKKAKK